MNSNAEVATGGSRIGRHGSRFALGCAAFAVTSCLIVAPRSRAEVSARSPPAGPEAPLAIVILTLDGVRWREVFDGVDAKLASERGLPPSAVVGAAELMPNLHAIIRTEGAALGAPDHGAAISASGPNFVSLPGYAEILSGRRVTACRDNQCQGANAPTLIDQLASGSALDRPDVALVASWGEIAKVSNAQACRAAVSSGRHGGATRELFARDALGKRLLHSAEGAEPAPGNGDFRPDALTAELALHHLKVQTPRFMFIGLGEPDEFGHLGDYAGYLAALRQADARIAEVARELQRLASHGTRTGLFITADHGRADSFNEHGDRFPESGRVWLVATGSAIAARGYAPAPRARYLADLAPTVRAIAGLPRDTDPSAGTPLFELLGSNLAAR